MFDIDKMIRYRIERLGMILFAIIMVAFMFGGCACWPHKPLPTGGVVTIRDTTYLDTIIYNKIERDSIITTTKNIEVDSIVWKEHVKWKTRVKYHGSAIYMPYIEATKGLAYGKAWVDNSQLKLLVVQRDSNIAIRLDSMIQQVYQKDSITVVINKRVKTKRAEIKALKKDLWLMRGATIGLAILLITVLVRKRR
jgi:hypothetical protein